MLKKLHNKLIKRDTIAPKEGQRDLLCSSKESCRCPSLGYQQSESVDIQEYVDKAFDVLFELILQDRKQTYEATKINSHIR